MTLPSEVTDAALLHAISQHQVPALDALYDRHARRLYALIYSILQDHAATEEVVQDTFLQIWYTAHTYTRSGVGAAWLWRIARNKALEHLRRVRRTPPLTPLDTEVSGDSLPLHVPSVAGDVQHQDCYTQLTVALRAIPQEQALCITLAYFEGLSLHQIACSTLTPLATVKSRLRRGLQKLATVLQAHGYRQSTDLL